MKRYLLLATLCSALCFSCTRPDGAFDSLDIRLETDSATNQRGGCFIYITAGGTWTLSLEAENGGDPSWAYLSKESGEGDATAVLSYDYNGGDEPRSLTVKLEGANGKSVSASFTQEGRIFGPISNPMDLKPDKVAKWMELPATSDNDDRYYFSHDMTIAGRKIRNYSFDLDITAKIAVWVAYPLNKALIGSGGRSDEWGLDPKVPKAYQSVIFSGYKGGYDRGHQLPSADRYNANVSTFYGTNMTPQLGKLNQNAWATLEGMVRDWSYQFDTLYVVTGADINGSRSYAADNEGKKITVPVGYFKALLGYKRSATIGITPSTGGYTAIGFYFEHRSYSDNDIMAQSMTIDALEEKLGLDFFVNLPATIGESYASKVESTRDPWWR